MKLGRFSAILDAYGAAPERWPEEERESAMALARSSLPAARALARARALDTALMAKTFPDIALEPEHFTHLHAAIVSEARRLTGNWFGRWFGIDLAPRQLWPSIVGLAFATVLGFAVGLGGLLHADADRDSEEVSVLSPIDLAAIGQ